jgi:hypothetical protein
MRPWTLSPNTFVRLTLRRPVYRLAG